MNPVESRSATAGTRRPCIPAYVSDPIDDVQQRQPRRWKFPLDQIEHIMYIEENKVKLVLDGGGSLGYCLPKRSFSKDPAGTGSYLRAMNDIDVALDVLRVSAMPPAAQLVFLYAGCEKLAAIIDGRVHSQPTPTVLRSGYAVRLSKVIENCGRIGNAPDPALLTQIFKKDDPESARELRHLFMHQLGPSHAKKLNVAAATLVPAMRQFLNYSAAARTYIARL